MSFPAGSWAPSNTVAWAEAYLHTKWHLDPFSRLATTYMSRKLGGAAVPLFRGGAGFPCNTMWLWTRPIPVPSGILIHAAVLPQYMDQNWGTLCPFLEGRGPHLTQFRLGSGLPLYQVAS